MHTKQCSIVCTTPYLSFQLLESHFVCFSVRQLSKSIPQFDAVLYENEWRPNTSRTSCAKIRVDNDEILHQRAQVFERYSSQETQEMHGKWCVNH